MSQEKVDRYKQEKANRKKIMHKQRMMGVLRKCVLSLAGLALVGWASRRMICMSPGRNGLWWKQTIPRLRITWTALWRTRRNNA